jgi:hypothetical protein
MTWLHSLNAFPGTDALGSVLVDQNLAFLKLCLLGWYGYTGKGILSLQKPSQYGTSIF